NHVLPELGAIELQRLDAAVVDRLYMLCRKRGLSPVTLSNLHSLLKRILKSAVRAGKLAFLANGQDTERAQRQAGRSRSPLRGGAWQASRSPKRRLAPSPDAFSRPHRASAWRGLRAPVEGCERQRASRRTGHWKDWKQDWCHEAEDQA